MGRAEARRSHPDSQYPNGNSDSEGDTRRTYWDILDRAPIVAVVVAGGRVGSDFLQSLFDGHPEVLTFDGPLYFDEFYQTAVTLWGTSGGFLARSLLKAPSPEDFFNEFAWRHVHAFKSRYDILENRHKLGPQRDESVEVDMQKFVEFAVYLLGGGELTRRNAFLAIYGAYALARGDNLLRKSVLLHHIHHMEKLPALLEDFPKLKVIAAVRDPRSGYLSTVEHLNRYSGDVITPAVHAYVVKRILDEAEPLASFRGVEVRVNLLERLHREPDVVLGNMCRWIGISFHPCLLRSTWGGKEWWGDALSDDLKDAFNPEMYTQSIAKWRARMSFQDRLLFEILMSRKMDQYGYVQHYRSVWWRLLGACLIFIPNAVERRLFKQCRQSMSLVCLLKWCRAFLNRCGSMLRKLGRSLARSEHVFEHF